MFMSKKNVFGFSAVLFAVVVGGYLLFVAPTPQPVVDKGQNVQQEVAASVVVASERYDVSVPEGSSALAVMEAARAQTAFDFQGEEYAGIGFFVQEINGTSSTQDHFWLYYVNDEEAQVGVSDYIIQAGDVVTWRYEAAE